MDNRLAKSRTILLLLLPRLAAINPKNWIRSLSSIISSNSLYRDLWDVLLLFQASFSLFSFLSLFCSIYHPRCSITSERNLFARPSRPISKKAKSFGVELEAFHEIRDCEWTFAWFRVFPCEESEKTKAVDVCVCLCFR